MAFGTRKSGIRAALWRRWGDDERLNRLNDLGSGLLVRSTNSHNDMRGTDEPVDESERS